MYVICANFDSAQNCYQFILYISVEKCIVIDIDNCMQYIRDINTIYFLVADNIGVYDNTLWFIVVYITLKYTAIDYFFQQQQSIVILDLFLMNSKKCNPACTPSPTDAKNPNAWKTTNIISTFNPFLTNVTFWFPLKAQENLRFFGVFSRYQRKHWPEMG